MANNVDREDHIDADSSPELAGRARSEFEPPSIEKLGKLSRVVKQSGSVTVSGGSTKWGGKLRPFEPPFDPPSEGR